MLIFKKNCGPAKWHKFDLREFLRRQIGPMLSWQQTFYAKIPHEEKT